MTKYLVMGAGGFVASHLIDLLLENKEEVIGSIRWNEDIHRIKTFENKIKIVYLDQLDLSSIIRVLAENKPDVISFLSAQSFVPYSFSVPINTIETNGVGCINLLEAIRLIRDYVDKNYNPLVHIVSSSEVYGKVPKEEQPINEKQNYNPGNQYGIGKVLADVSGQFYAKYYDMKILITRMFTHTGLRRTMMSAECFYAKWIAEAEKQIENCHFKNGVPSLNGKCCWCGENQNEHKGDQKELICNLGNMESIRTWRDVRDAVTDYYQLFKEQKTGIYNISGDTTKSIQEVLDYLLSISKLDKSKIKFETDSKLLRKIDVDCQYADISKFKSEIEQRKEYTFEQCMQDLLGFWRERVK